MQKIHYLYATLNFALLAPCLLAFAGDLPLPVILMLSSRGCNLKGAGPGFTLPVEIGDLDPGITKLNLRWFNLTGNS